MTARNIFVGVTDLSCVIPAQAGIHKFLQVTTTFMKKQPAVYILASQRNGTLYIGVTGNLQERVWQHKQGEVGGFTQQYHVYTLVHYELFPTMIESIAREKQLKKWNRSCKVRLIEERNPEWSDLWDEING